AADGALAARRILSHDGIVDDVKRRRYYEKPCRRRQRLAYEACRRVYGAEMARKLAFLARKSRPDPWLGR
ncbi:RT21 protein, partial [Casuarius casuarius]|nr:RT21 protein [Casuarius casuarius]